MCDLFDRHMEVKILCYPRYQKVHIAILEFDHGDSQYLFYFLTILNNILLSHLM